MNFDFMKRGRPVQAMAIGVTNGQPIVSSDLNFKDLGNGYLLGIPVPVIAMLGVFVVAWFVLERTRYGRHVYAVGGNLQAARLAGVQVNRILLSVYVIFGSIPAIRAARRRIDASGKDIRLEVDGGIKTDNIRRVADAGADTFVAGSAIFGKPDYKAVIDQMRAALK